MSPRAILSERGWAKFPATPDTLRWAEAAHDVADRILQDAEHQKTWLQCEGTWFVGVDVLPSDAAGALHGVPLRGPAVDALPAGQDLHPAQLSVIYPGYPKPRQGESDAAFRFREKRYAAHVDGILADGPKRRRFLREPHAIILGIALNDVPPEAGPLVVWSHSQVVMRGVFQQAFRGVPDDEWSDIDVTEVYTQARKSVFETCTPQTIPMQRGEMVLVHRLALHGIAPWRDTGRPWPSGRRIAYFRPQLTGGVADWISAD
ncbi:MAG: phytanoyl-CoA dioxygenase family protein [Rhodobacteraceae bacterium]|nr:phytanoyl-CoA dioxygenase family protein [Paracoccaceae bacterium]